MQDALAARITGFVATMRANGFPVGIGEAQDALRIAAVVGVLEREPLRWGWRSLLCARPGEWHRFDDLFDSYWRPANRTVLVDKRSGGAGQLSFDPDDGADGGKAGPAIQSGGNDSDTRAGRDDGSLAREGASAAAAVEQVDFRSLTDREQTGAIESAIRRFARRLQQLRTRRERSSSAGHRLDLRRTIRCSIGAGGVPARLYHLAPRRVRPRLVLLLDVSKSMSLYSFFYLRIARALTAELTDVHVFLYHTHLTHVSEALKDPDPHRAQQRLQILSAGWAGGTRIGDCIAAFNREHAAHLVHARTAVIVVSDGYDTGAAGVLGRELALLARRARRVVWLNPLKANPDYVPVARGMREAMPSIDLFAGGRDLRSVEAALVSIMAVL
jgi:uncharacterized protein with von Willebrand factor type A (vWA) domain